MGLFCVVAAAGPQLIYTGCAAIVLRFCAGDRYKQGSDTPKKTKTIGGKGDLSGGCVGRCETECVTLGAQRDLWTGSTLQARQQIQPSNPKAAKSPPSIHLILTANTASDNR
eukprot:2863277-Amphidinium_carterae.1